MYSHFELTVLQERMADMARSAEQHRRAHEAHPGRRRRGRFASRSALARPGFLATVRVRRAR